jgi:hypothetical protein
LAVLLGAVTLGPVFPVALPWCCREERKMSTELAALLVAWGIAILIGTAIAAFTIWDERRQMRKFR